MKTILQSQFQQKETKRTKTDCRHGFFVSSVPLCSNVSASLLARLPCALCLLFWLTMLLVVTASAATRYVWQESPRPTPPYTTWATAAHVIQGAVDAAVDGDTVLVTNGVYATGGKVFSGETNRVAVDKPVTLRSVRGPGETIIDGLGSVRCVFVGEGASVSGFTLTNGLAFEGGGVACYWTGAVVSNCVLTGNSAVSGGGVKIGILYDCTLSCNSAFSGGGAAGWNEDYLGCTLVNCVLSNNSSAFGAGATYSTLRDCTLTGNHANGDGGGSLGSTLTRCELIGNFSAGLGGGAFESFLTNCTVASNSAGDGGGVADSELHSCVLQSNAALAGFGGGWGTSGDGGGAISSTLNNCTLTGNSADVYGGGAWGCNLNNSIVVHNGAYSASNYGGSALNYCCTTPDPGGVGNITNTPLFVDTNNWADLRLRPDSPCVDAGNNDYVTNLTDLDGNPRILNRTVDMGAYEYQPPPDTHYVNMANPSPAVPYTTWATAATNIQGAVDAACAGDTVLVTNGVYASGWRVVDGVTNRVVVDKPLNLLSVNGPEVTMIDGCREDGRRNYRCVYLADGVMLSGLKLHNGWGRPNGGGVFCASTNAIVADCHITRCSAGQGGGAYSGTLSNCVLFGNSAGEGGGAYSAALNNCVLDDNASEKGGGASDSILVDCILTGNFNYSYQLPGQGGGVYRCTLINCTLTENRADEGGGAYDCNLSGCTLMNNRADKSEYWWANGGGACQSTLDSCVLAGNYAEVTGGGAYLCALTNCTLAGNSAPTSGGAGDSTLINCTLTENRAGYDGGAGGRYAEDSHSILVNCLVVSNTASAVGGARGTLKNCLITGNTASGIGGAYGTLENCTVVGNSASNIVGGAAGWLTNCIVYFNSAPIDPNCWSDYEINYTCTLPMATNGVGNITNAPLFVDTNDWVDLRLRPDSPCIDAGNNDFVTALTDLDGNPRILNGIVDMGAYEFVPPTPAELVQHLIKLVNESDLPHQQPLLATLNAALASIERGNHNSASGQLGAFQNKVRAQVAKKDAALAMELTDGAGQVIAALSDDKADKVAAKLRSLKRGQGGKMKLKLIGQAGQTYIVEASTNLVDWEAVGVATVQSDGSFEFADTSAAKYQSRFYRIVSR